MTGEGVGMKYKVGDEIFARIKIAEIKSVYVGEDELGWATYEDAHIDEHERIFFKEELLSPIAKIEELLEKENERIRYYEKYESHILGSEIINGNLNRKYAYEKCLSFLKGQNNDE